MTKNQAGPQPDMDLIFAGPEDFDACTHQIIEMLKQQGILSESNGSQPAVQFSI
jgi:hypothetical protein